MSGTGHKRTNDAYRGLSAFAKLALASERDDARVTLTRADVQALLAVQDVADRVEDEQIARAQRGEYERALGRMCG